MGIVFVGAIDPIETFQSQLNDLAEITEAFRNTPALDGIDYLRAANTIRENLMAIAHTTWMAVTSDVVQSDRVTQEQIDAHNRELEERGWSSEHMMLHALQRIGENANSSLSPEQLETLLGMIGENDEGDEGETPNV